MMTGRIHGERIPAQHFDLKTLTPMLPQRMPTLITCCHCTQEFEGRGMWNAYARHLKAEHR